MSNPPPIFGPEISTDEYTFALGCGRDTVSMGAVRILGGSVDADPDRISPAPSNTTAQVVRVVVEELAPGAAVAFDGLPDDYGRDGIYADADGKAYLWLPEDWDTTTITPRRLSASRGRLTSDAGLRTSSSGVTHTFAANGYQYTVEISADGGTVSAERGEALKLTDLTIRDFDVEDGWLLISVKASPATWLYGFADALAVRASETLPIPDTDDSLLDMSKAELRLEDGENATIAVPLSGDSPCRFFKVSE